MTCGNGQVDSGEECDGEARANGGDSCRQRGFHEGELSCSDTCTIDVSTCAGRCGDGIPDAEFEVCDTVVNPPACADWGYDAGTVRCSATCTVDVSGCWAAGWRELSIRSIPGAELNAGAGDLIHYALVVGDGGKMAFLDGLEWYDVEPSLTDAALHGATLVDEDNGWVVGAGGTLLRLLNGEWSQVDSPTTHVLRAVHATSVDLAVAVGDAGTILEFDGTAWQTIASGTDEDLTAAHTHGNTACVVGPDDIWLIRSGGTWQSYSMSNSEDDEDIVGCWVQEDGEVTAFTRSARRTVANGVARPIQDLPAAISGLWPGRSVAIAWTDDGFVRFDGNGWTSLSGPPLPADARGGVAVGEGEHVLVTYDDNPTWQYGGAGWQEGTFPGGSGWRGIGGTGISNLDNVVVGALGAVKGSVGEPRFSHAPLNDVTLIQDRYVAVGAQGTVLVLGENVEATLDTAFPYVTPLLGVWGTALDDFWVVGDEGLIMHRDGDGWTEVPYPDGQDDHPPMLHAIRGTAPDRIFAVGDKGVILRFDGSAWERLPPVTTARLLNLLVTDSEVLVVGENGLLAEQMPSGDFRVEALGGGDLYAIGETGEVGLLAAGDDATFFRRVSPGTPWVAISSPLAEGTRAMLSTPAGIVSAGIWGQRLRIRSQPTAEGILAIDPLYAFPGSFNSVASMDLDEAIAVGARGAAFVYDGKGWSRRETPTFAPLNDVTYGPNGHPVAVGDDGSVIVGSEGGWQQVTPVTQARLLRVLVQEDGTVWAVGEGGVVVTSEPSWGAVESPTTETLYGIAETPEGIMVGGVGGLWLRAGDGWTAVEFPHQDTHGQITGLHYDDELLLVGTGVQTEFPRSAFIHHRADGEWLPSYPSPHSATRFCVRGTNDIFATTLSAGVVIHYDGLAWSRIKTPTSLTGLSCSPGGGRVFAVGDRGEIPRFFTFDSAFPQPETDGSGEPQAGGSPSEEP